MKPRLLPTFSVVFASTLLGVFLYQGVHEHTMAPTMGRQVQSEKTYSPEDKSPASTFALEDYQISKREINEDHPEMNNAKGFQ